MAKIAIRDNCLAPEKDTFLTYSGPNPWSIVEKIQKSIKPFFHVSSVGFNNERINWDRTGDTVEFFSLWWVKKDASEFSHMRFHIKIQGSQNKNTMEGKFSMRLTADVNTNYTGWGPILRPLWLMYSYLFYNKIRRKYMDRCRELALGFRNELKEHMGLKTTTIGPPKGVVH